MPRKRIRARKLARPGDRRRRPDRGFDNEPVRPVNVPLLGDPGYVAPKKPRASRPTGPKPVKSGGASRGAPPRAGARPKLTPLLGDPGYKPDIPGLPGKRRRGAPGNPTPNGAARRGPTGPKPAKPAKPGVARGGAKRGDGTGVNKPAIPGLRGGARRKLAGG